MSFNRKLKAFLTDTKFYITVVVAILVLGYNYGKKEAVKENKNKELVKNVKKLSDNVQILVQNTVTKKDVKAIVDSQKIDIYRYIKKTSQETVNKVSGNIVETYDIIIDNVELDGEKSEKEIEKYKKLMRGSVEKINARIELISENKKINKIEILKIDYSNYDKMDYTNYNGSGSGLAIWKSCVDDEFIDTIQPAIIKEKKGLFNFIKKNKTDY